MLPPGSGGFRQAGAVDDHEHQATGVLGLSAGNVLSLATHGVDFCAEATKAFLKAFPRWLK